MHLSDNLKPGFSFLVRCSLVLAFFSSDLFTAFGLLRGPSRAGASKISTCDTVSKGQDQLARAVELPIGEPLKPDKSQFVFETRLPFQEQTAF